MGDFSRRRRSDNDRSIYRRPARDIANDWPYRRDANGLTGSGISPGRIEGKCVPKGRVIERGFSKRYEGRWPVDVAPMQ
jgi:hypothetical protein